MRNKWFVSLLMVVVMMCACWTGAVAEEVRKTFTSGAYSCVLLDDGTVEIERYYGSATDFVIADTIDGKKVTAIGEGAFRYYTSMTSVIIPDSVTAIGEKAFYECKSLTSVTIPESVTSIGDYAFCSCKSLTSVTIPNSVTSIGNYAFFACDSLTNITIPDSVVQIGANPFAYCGNLRSISVSPDHPYLAVIDGVLFQKADKILIAYPAGIKSTTYSIPYGITTIGDSAFYNCSSLKSVTIPDTVTSIGNDTFYCCSSLTSIAIPNSVTFIGDDAFLWCDSLRSAVISDSVTFIGNHAFFMCIYLTLTVPRNSYALEYAKTNNIPYTYPDANDWLNN